MPRPTLRELAARVQRLETLLASHPALRDDQLLEELCRSAGCDYVAVIGPTRPQTLTAQRRLLAKELHAQGWGSERIARAMRKFPGAIGYLLHS